MKQPVASNSSLKSELMLLFCIVVGVACIAGFFYWWGSKDPAFAQRKATVWLNQLTRVTNERPNMTGMNLFVSYSKEADTTARLLQTDLDPETWLKVAKQRADAMCKLVSMGDVARAPDLLALCTKLKNSPDPRARELGHATEFSLDFERQYVMCKHKMIVQEIIDFASEGTTNETSQQLIEKIRDQQKSDWKMAGIANHVEMLANKLPRDNKLTPYSTRFLSQLIDIEESLENEPNMKSYDEWIEQAKKLVNDYPNNVEICRSIVTKYDRLADLYCFDEAKKLLDVALEVYDDAGSDLNDEVVHLIDRRAASEIQLDRWKSLVWRKPKEAASLIEPIKLGAQQLQQKQLVTPAIVDRFFEVVDAMENAQQYDSLALARTALLEVFSTNEAIAERCQEYCDASAKRVAMLGKPFAFPSADIVESPLDPSVFQDKVTAVAFFAADDLASLNVLQSLDQLFNWHNGSGFEMIAINIDPNLDMVRTMMSAQAPLWSVVVAKEANESGKNPLAVEYGILRAPYLILVDSQGEVVDVGLSVKDMWVRALDLKPDLKVQAAPRRAGPAR